eukprot:189392-Pyramimonas_sp.AAC.1
MGQRLPLEGPLGALTGPLGALLGFFGASSGFRDHLHGPPGLSWAIWKRPVFSMLLTSRAFELPT